MSARLSPQREAEYTALDLTALMGAEAAAVVGRMRDALLAEVWALSAELNEARARMEVVDRLALPEKLRVATIAPEYRSGYVHALADMREAWLALDMAGEVTP